MRRIQAIALVCMFATPMAFAQTAASPAKMQLAQKMYDTSGVGNVFQGMEYNILSGTMNEIGQGLGDKAACPALQQAAIQPQVAAFKGKLDGIFRGLSDAQFRTEASKVFSDTYTEDEMKQILAFMQSPAGQKMASSSAEVNKKISDLALTRAKAHKNDIASAQGDFANTIKKIADACPATPASAPQAPPKRK